MKLEVTHLVNYLEEEVPRMHSFDHKGKGEDRTEGLSRALMVKEAEKLRASALDKSLQKDLPDQAEKRSLVTKNPPTVENVILEGIDEYIHK